jgi:hypothetical protein
MRDRVMMRHKRYTVLTKKKKERGGVKSRVRVKVRFVVRVDTNDF